VFVAKTTMPDYGMLSSGLSTFHALARNPWDVSQNPGGSSAGAGVAAAVGYGPLHIGTDLGGSSRLPACWCGIAGLKPSFGGVPITPPFAGRAAGPMTRSVADAALMIGVLSAPDARDSMSLPPQPIRWPELAREVRGLRIGLWLDAGWGLALDAEVRALVEAAAHAFEAAGAIVEPLAPFTTRAMADGIDRFWRLRSWLDISALPEARRARVLPFIVDWARGGAEASGEQVYRGWYQMHAMREATVAATQPFDFVLAPVSPVTGYPAEWPGPTNDAARSLEHIGFTVPFNMSEQPAASVNAGYTARGMPVGLQIIGRRFDDLGVLQLARAWEQLRPAQRAWPAVPG
jgi:aspartyl-tRNA(Asn)/glutamyl-tRNA(Gln) amidotransferase subunit A